MSKAREQLAVVVALQKALNAKAKQLRNEADAELNAAYDDDGVEKVTLKLGKEAVGSYSVTFSEPHAEQIGDDVEAYQDFMLCNGFAHLRKSIDTAKLPFNEIARNWPDAVTETFEVDEDACKVLDGLPDGGVYVSGTSVVVPGMRWVPKERKGTIVKVIDPLRVCQLALQSGDVESLLLGDGGDE